MSKNNSNSIYMHIVHGRPGMFDGDQIVIVNRYSKLSLNDMFKHSLKDIREEQAKSVDYRQRKGYDSPKENYASYDYIRINKRDFRLAPEADFKLWRGDHQ